MVYITGDTHGLFDLDKVINYFKNKNVSKKDYLIILGDVAVCFHGGQKDERVRKTLQNLPITVLFIDGNHDHHQQLASYPVCDWNGGKVHFIEEDIIHLMRGYVFNIEGHTFFTFGGASSVDRAWRTEGIDWWPEELPSIEERERGLMELDKVNNEVDYILTHTAPYHVAALMHKEIWKKEIEFRYYLQQIADTVKFKKWFFGHFHEDRNILNRFIGLYNDVYELIENTD